MAYSNKKILNLGILAFAPLFLFTLWLIFYFVILSPYMGADVNGSAAAGATVRNYTPLFILLAVNFTVAFIAFLYFLMNMWTRKDVDTGVKITWVIFLAVFNIFAFPVYWAMHIKNDHIVRDNASPSLS